MDLFLPESGLVIWMTIAFGIVYFILSKFGFPIILKSINEREKYIIKSLDAANEAQQKLLEIEDKGKEIIANAEGLRTTPSIVYIKGDELLVGELAKRTFKKHNCMTVAETPLLEYERYDDFIGEDGFFSMIFDFSYSDLDMSKGGFYYSLQNCDILYMMKSFSLYTY